MDGAEQRLRDHVERCKLPPAGEVVRRDEHSMQKYRLHVGETTVTMHGAAQRGVARKRNRPQKGSAIRVRIVISELRKEGQRTLRWVLLTNLKESALSVVKRYLLR